MVPLRGVSLGSAAASSTSVDSVVKARWTRYQSVGSTFTDEPVSSVAGRFCFEHLRMLSLLLAFLPLLPQRIDTALHPFLVLLAGINGPW